MAKHAPVHQMTLPQFEAAFSTEDQCRAYLTLRRWGNNVECPRCGAPEPYALAKKPYHWSCFQCQPNGGYRFSVLVGTIFENTNKPLTMWFKVIYLMMVSKKGMSALQIHRMIGTGSYQTAWSMCHRVRAGMADESFQKLMGFVEVDETFVGGKDKNRHANKRHHVSGASDKMVVAGAIQRGGKVLARVIARADNVTLRRFINEAVSHNVSLLSTDDAGYYRTGLSRFKRGSVNHSKGEYVVGAIHTNTIEGFWSQFKRGIIGTFHKVTAKYLPLYVAEFEFRYNNRLNDDIFGAAVATV